MRNIFFVDNVVGYEIAQWVISAYPEDIASFCVVSRESPICQLAEENSINLLLYSDIVALEPKDLPVFDYGFLVWWPRIVPKRVLEAARYGVINTHPSYLPHNRGKHYNFWAIVEEVPFGVSLHFVNEAIDCGDILARRCIPVSWEDTGSSLYYKAQKKIIELFIDEYPLVREHRIVRIPQNQSDGSFHYAHEIDKVSKIELDNKYTARELLNLLRGRTFFPYPACSFDDNGKSFEIRISITESKYEA